MTELRSATVFDSIIWSAAVSGQRAGLVDAVWRSEQADSDRTTQITVDTVFTDSGHPFDLIEPKNMSSVERISNATVDVLRSHDSPAVGARRAVDRVLQRFFAVRPGGADRRAAWSAAPPCAWAPVARSVRAMTSPWSTEGR